MPVSLTMMLAPVALLSMMPPVGPGRSLMTSAFWPRVWNTRFGDVGRPALASVGTSDDEPHLHPTHTGRSTSPCSNSTHTPAPIGGTRYTPIGGPVGPASGTHGSAQLDGTPGPSTSGTYSNSRPRRYGSMFCATTPRYFPKK